MISYPAIIIDGRVFQTNTWHRGMGRYTLGLLKGIAEQDASPRVILLLANDLPELGDREIVIRSMNENIEFHTLPLVSGSSDVIEKENAKIVDVFVSKKSIKGSLFVISSLFTFDYSPFSPSETINACIFYDLLPLTHWEMLGQYYGYEYFRRYRYIYEMDKLFAISEHVKDELVEYLGMKEEDVVNISGADVSLVVSGDKVNVTNDSQKGLINIFYYQVEIPHIRTCLGQYTPLSCSTPIKRINTNLLSLHSIQISQKRI